MRYKRINELVAERVLGFEPCDAWVPVYGGWMDALVGGESFRLIGSECQHTNCYPRGHPAKYTSSMDLAWKVVEEMTEPPRGEWNDHNTKFMLWFEKADLWAMSEKEAAFAICTASLLILGVVEEKDGDLHERT